MAEYNISIVNGKRQKTKISPTRRSTVSEVEQLGSSDEFVLCVETGKIYNYVTVGSPVLDVDGVDVLNTADGGDTRFVSTSFINLNDIANVDFLGSPGLIDGDTLIWNESLGKWINGAAGAEPAGNSGEIQFNDSGDLGATAETFWDIVNSKMSVGNPSSFTGKFAVKGDALKDMIAEFIDDVENSVFEIYKDGSIRLYETSETITEDGSIWLDLNSNYLKLLKDSTEYYLNIDQFQDQRDISWVNPQNGDIMVWNITTGEGENQHTEDFDLILYGTHVNANSDVQLVFDIPAGYKITSVIIKEIGGFDAGDISIGSTSGGYDVVYNTTIEANDAVDCLISKQFFSEVDDTSLYITSNAWGSGILTVYAKFEKSIG